jgi:hypothetical protein
MSIFMFLKAGKLVELSGERAVIGFKKENSFHKEALEIGEGRQVIEEAVNKVTGASPKLEFTFLEFLGESSDGQAEPAAPSKTAKTDESIKPRVEDAMDIFGGHVVRDVLEDKQ